jgi:hypothetical protein
MLARQHLIAARIRATDAAIRRRLLHSFLHGSIKTKMSAWVAERHAGTTLDGRSALEAGPSDRFTRRQLVGCCARSETKLRGQMSGPDARGFDAVRANLNRILFARPTARSQSLSF